LGGGGVKGSGGKNTLLAMMNEKCQRKLYKECSSLHIKILFLLSHVRMYFLLMKIAVETSLHYR
jgi:hypothetical protein